MKLDLRFRYRQVKIHWFVILAPFAPFQGAQSKSPDLSLTYLSLHTKTVFFPSPSPFGCNARVIPHLDLSRIPLTLPHNVVLNAAAAKMDAMTGHDFLRDFAINCMAYCLQIV